MSGLKVPASVSAVISIAERLLSLTRHLISSIRLSPRKIEHIQIEMFHLRLLTETGALSQAGSDQLYRPCRGTGLVALLWRHLLEMDEKFQPHVSFKMLHFGGSLPRWEFSWHTISWPTKRERAQRLLSEIRWVMQKICYLTQPDTKYDKPFYPFSSPRKSC